MLPSERTKNSMLEPSVLRILSDRLSERRRLAPEERRTLDSIPGRPGFADLVCEVKDPPRSGEPTLAPPRSSSFDPSLAPARQAYAESMRAGDRLRSVLRPRRLDLFE